MAAIVVGPFGIERDETQTKPTMFHDEVQALLGDVLGSQGDPRTEGHFLRYTTSIPGDLDKQDVAKILDFLDFLGSRLYETLNMRFGRCKMFFLPDGRIDVLRLYIIPLEG